jgi:hypothetical protein
MKPCSVYEHKAEKDEHAAGEEADEFRKEYIA